MRGKIRMLTFSEERSGGKTNGIKLNFRCLGLVFLLGLLLLPGEHVSPLRILPLIPFSDNRAPYPQHISQGVGL